MRRVVGCMTGTSIDALDASLVEIEGHGLAMRAKPVRNITRDLGDLAPRLRALAEQQPMTAGHIAAIARDFGLLHADSILELLAGERADLVCVHGQTVFHQPPLSWQLMQPAPIARAVGCPVVYDLRQADLAAGGQGAPITPIADYVLFGDIVGKVTIVNLGGFCNITQLPGARMDGRQPAPNSTFYTPWETYHNEVPAILPRDQRDCAAEVSQIAARDVCACNQLLDAVARAVLEKPFDLNGESALAGQVDEIAAADLTSILLRQSGARRSLGTGDELATWITKHQSRVAPKDLAATAAGCVGFIIRNQATTFEQLVLAGGGVRNCALVAAIAEHGHQVVTTADYGVPIEYREAICFAVLGALCQDKVPITIPAVTGVQQAPLSGAWVYP